MRLAGHCQAAPHPLQRPDPRRWRAASPRPPCPTCKSDNFKKPQTKPHPGMAGVPCQGRARCWVPCHRAGIVAALALCNAACVSCFAVQSSPLAGGLPLFRRPAGLSRGLSERHAPSLWANRRGTQLVRGVSLDRHHNFDIKKDKVRILVGLAPRRPLLRTRVSCGSPCLSLMAEVEDAVITLAHQL